MKLLILAAILGLQTTTQAAAPLKRMFFSCEGNDKNSTALQINSNAYFNGQIQGLELSLRGFYDGSADEKINDPRMVIAKQAKYTPKNPALMGFDKFIIKTRNNTIAFIIPTRTELEKQWASGSESRRDKHNDFKGYAQLADSSGDSFGQIQMDCRLNWMP
jgi:hypothetical protein